LRYGALIPQDMKHACRIISVTRWCAHRTATYFINFIEVVTKEIFNYLVIIFAHSRYVDSLHILYRHISWQIMLEWPYTYVSSTVSLMITSTFSLIIMIILIWYYFAGLSTDFSFTYTTRPCPTRRCFIMYCYFIEQPRCWFLGLVSLSFLYLYSSHTIIVPHFRSRLYRITSFLYIFHITSLFYFASFDIVDTFLHCL
jgi:hypothetical protein